MTEKLKGEGDRIVIERVRVRQTCGYCSELATYKNTYLDEGYSGARNNPSSSAYRRDDCSWCSDFDDYVCHECHSSDEEDNVPDGHKWCSTFDIQRHPHMFLKWEEQELEIVLGQNVA